jgi:hypothetical protein
MEIIELSVFICLLFQVSYETFFTLFVSYYLLMYYRTNKHLLMTNYNIASVFILFIILSYELLALYLRIYFYYLHNTKIFLYIYDKLENINKYYLDKKNYVISSINSYFFITKILFMNFFGKKKVIINKIKTDEDALMFLNNLTKSN